MKGGVVPLVSATSSMVFELGGLEAQLADLLEELALLPDAVGEEAEDHRGRR